MRSSKKNTTKMDSKAEHKADTILAQAEAEGVQTALRAEADKAGAWKCVWGKAKAKHPAERTTTLWSKAARIAAVLIPAIAVTLVIARGGEPDYTLYAATTAADTLQLADGSTVILGKGSELEFRQTADGREARLRGIAKFSVRHDAGAPFSIDATEATVRVLGTTFSVEHWPGESRVRTRVEHGLVSMSAGGEEVKLGAGEEAVWTGSEMNKTASAAGSIAIGSRRMDFHSASLRQVVDEMLTCYHGQLRGVNFDCDEDSVVITTSFENQSLESVIEELNMHFDKKLILHNGYLTITD